MIWRQISKVSVTAGIDTHHVQDNQQKCLLEHDLWIMEVRTHQNFEQMWLLSWGGEHKPAVMLVSAGQFVQPGISFSACSFQPFQEQAGWSLDRPAALAWYVELWKNIKSAMEEWWERVILCVNVYAVYSEASAALPSPFTKTFHTSHYQHFITWLSHLFLATLLIKLLLFSA